MPAVSSSLVTIHFKQAILIHILQRVFITKNIQKSLVSQKIVVKKAISAKLIVVKTQLIPQNQQALLTSCCTALLFFNPWRREPKMAVYVFSVLYHLFLNDYLTFWLIQHKHPDKIHNSRPVIFC